MALNIFLEKPIAITEDDVESVWRLLRDYPKVVTVNLSLRGSPVSNSARDHVRNGDIGRVVSVQYVNNAHYGDNYFRKWMRTSANTGGLLLQKATDHLDLVNNIIGLRPVSVAAFGSRLVYGGDMPNDLTCGQATAKCVASEGVADAPSGQISAAVTTTVSSTLTTVNYGKGRAAYIPQIVDPASQPSMVCPNGVFNFGLDYTNWVVPECADDINKAIDWLMDGRDRVRVRAERGMLAEFLMQESQARMLVHLVNLRPEPQQDCSVEIRIPGASREIEVLSPPTDEDPVWRVVEENGTIKVFFDKLDTYALLVIRSEA